MTTVHSQRFGTPQRTLGEWLEVFAKDCENDRSLNPLRLLRMKARADTFRDLALWSKSWSLGGAADD